MIIFLRPRRTRATGQTTGKQRIRFISELLRACWAR